MKSKIFAVAIILAAFTTHAFSQDVLKFDITNNTGIDLHSVFVTQADVNNWGEDIIPEDIFPTGSTVEVTVPVKKKTICLHDIKVTDSDDNSVTFENIDFCELSELTFFIKNGVIKYTVTAQEAGDDVLTFEIENKTGFDLYGVFVTQSDVDHWGEDIIPEDTFPSGSIIEVTVPIADETICLHDIKVTDEANNWVMFENIDFCELSKLTFFVKDGVIKYRTE